MASRELGRSMLQVGGMPVARAAVPISNHDQDDDRDDGDADGMEGFQDNGEGRAPAPPGLQGPSMQACPRILPWVTS
jgi:hypothetical protein